MYVNYDFIEYAFLDDNDLKKYCDPEDKHKDIKEIINSIYEKILDYEKEGNSKFCEIRYNENLIGYFFYHKNILVSFGINVKHRNKQTLKKVFEDIKKEMNGEFESYMWERNERAINWLKKCGMKEVPCKINDVKKLKYILCQ